MPRGSVICLIVTKSKLKKGRGCTQGRDHGGPEENKIIDHLIVGSMPWNFDKAMVATTIFS